MSPTPRRYRLALATYLADSELSADDARLVPALSTQGIDALAVPWNQPDFDWRTVDGVLLRSTWDYVEHYDAFLAWLAALPVPVFNAAETVRWNSDKRYLLQLAAADLNVVATEIAQACELPARLATRQGEPVVVKPAISASARDTLRGTAGDDAFNAALAALPPDRDMLIQPYLHEIETQGEWSLVLIDGEYSHAVLKRPARGDFRVQPALGGTVQAAAPSNTLRTAGRAVLDGLRALGHPMPLYARADGIETGGQFTLMELELIEPALHWYADEQAAGRLARAVAARLSSVR